MAYTNWIDYTVSQKKTRHSIFVRNNLQTLTDFRVSLLLETYNKILIVFLTTTETRRYTILQNTKKVKVGEFLTHLTQ